MRKVFLTVLGLMLMTRLSSQELSLNSLFQMAEENSSQLHVARLGINIAAEGMKEARSTRLPELDVEWSAGYLGDGVLSDRDFTNWQHVDNPHFIHHFTLKAGWAIYSGGAVASGVRLAKIRQDMSELNLKHHRQEVRFLIAGQYLDICRMENQIKVVEENLGLIDTLVANTRARAKNGTALETGITRYELQREQLSLTHRRLADDVAILRYQLGCTLHADFSEATFRVDEDAETMISLADWQRVANKGNVDLLQASKTISISEQLLKIKRSELLPKFSVVFENHFDGPITIEVPVVNKNFNYWFVGVGVQYSISSLWKKNKAVKKAHLNLQEVREQQLLVSEKIGKMVQAAYVRLQTSLATLQVKMKGKELAVAHYDVTYSRYQNGLCLLADMLDAASARLDAETDLANSRINILYNYYQLKYLTSSL